MVSVPALREMAMGRWEGLTFAEIRAREPELCDRWLADPFAMPFPEGEGLAELRARAVPAFRTGSSSGTGAGASPSSPTGGPTA